MQAEFDYIACMKNRQTVQYTVRNVPREVDRIIRRKAKKAGCSLNEALLEAIRNSAGINAEAQPKRDLSWIAGSWQEDAAFDAILADMRKIDSEMWQ